MSADTILKAVLDAAGTRDDGRRTLTCSAAFDLADELGVELMDIAKVCNEHNVKITRCQLGCFA